MRTFHIVTAVTSKRNLTAMSANVVTLLKVLQLYYVNYQEAYAEERIKGG